MIKNNDVVSIVVACYNIDKYVEKCIESISRQTYRNIEVLLVDDGSTDNTAGILKKYAGEDERFKYLFKKNGGLSDARNYGISRAQGKYICFVDGDDYVDEKYIEKLLNGINGNDIAICFFNRVYSDKITVNQIRSEKYNLIKHPAAWNKMYSMEFLKKCNIKFLEGLWYEDLNFFGKLLLHHPRIGIVQESLYNYIQNSSSIMHTYNHKIFQIYTILEDIENYAKSNALYDDNKDLIEFMYVYHVLIGTVYRSSFMNEFNKAKIVEISNFVLNKYNCWWRNHYVKELPFLYRVYLTAIRFKLYGFLCFSLKHFNKYFNL